MERAQGLRAALVSILTGSSEVEVDCTADYERRLEELGEGKHALLEADPATYFLARRHWLTTDPERWQYDLLFQRLSSPSEPSTLRAAVVCRAGSGLETLRDLKGRSLGILSPYSLAEGRIQLSALERLGYKPERDFRVSRANSEENLCKALFSGLVDAVALPEGRLEGFLSQAVQGRLRDEPMVTLYRSDLLPGPVWCVHRRLARNRPDLVAQLRRQLPEAWPAEPLLPTRDAYYLSTMAWVESQN